MANLMNAASAGKHRTRYLVLRRHYDDADHICGIPESTNVVALVEKLQRRLAAEGHPTGVSWKIHYGTIGSALAASRSFGVKGGAA